MLCPMPKLQRNKRKGRRNMEKRAATKNHGIRLVCAPESRFFFRFSVGDLQLKRFPFCRECIGQRNIIIMQMYDARRVRLSQNKKLFFRSFWRRAAAARGHVKMCSAPLCPCPLKQPNETEFSPNKYLFLGPFTSMRTKDGNICVAGSRRRLLFHI